MNNESFVSSFTGEGAAGVASLDPPLIQQTKSEIRTLAGEMAKLAHGTSEPGEFFSGFLPRLVTAMGAEGAAVWQTNESLHKHSEIVAIDEAFHVGSLQLLAEHCLATQLLDADIRSAENRILPSEPHRRILECVIAEGTPILVPPQTVSLDADRPANPLEHSIIVIPVRIEDEVEFVLEVVQRASGGPAAQRGYLRFVAQMADLMADYLRRQSLRTHAAKVGRMQQFEYWLTSIAQASNPTRQIRMAADGLAELMDSYQVFIMRSGRRPKVLAASGLESFDPRSETILTAQLAERFLQQQSASQHTCIDLLTWKTGDERLTSVGKLYELMASKKLVRLRVSEGSAVVAILSLPEDVSVSPAEMQRIATSLFGLIDLQSAQGNWMRRLWPLRTSVRATKRVHRSAWHSWTMRAALTGLAAVIAFFPVPQQITTTAVLAPKSKNCYYAPSDATVTKIVVPDFENQQVKKGDLLLELKSIALNQSLSRLEADAIANSPRIQFLKSECLRAVPNSAESRRFSAELEQLELKSLEIAKEQELIEEEQAKLKIVAQEDGELTAWDIENRLRDRPVARGELLLTTCDPTAGWELQVSVPEYRVGLVSDALARSENRVIPMRFSLSSHPNVLMDGSLTWMAPQATRNAAGANVVLSTGTVEGELPLKKEGAIARVTIDCGRVPAIWLVVRDAYWACMSRLKMIW